MLVLEQPRRTFIMMRCKTFGKNVLRTLNCALIFSFEDKYSSLKITLMCAVT